jgi:hypothetical protein
MVDDYPVDENPISSKVSGSSDFPHEKPMAASYEFTEKKGVQTMVKYHL